jgi:hypothetical protein
MCDADLLGSTDTESLNSALRDLRKQSELSRAQSNAILQRHDHNDRGLICQILKTVRDARAKKLGA